MNMHYFFYSEKCYLNTLRNRTNILTSLKPKDRSLSVKAGEYPKVGFSVGNGKEERERAENRASLFKREWLMNTD